MSENSKIEWTDATFNPWIGCTKVSPGCDHCYAEVSTPARTMSVRWGPNATRHRTSASNWALPMKWNREADEFQAKHGRRRRVFCASLADVFDNAVPTEWRRELFDLIELTPRLDWLLLTKRIGNVYRMVSEARCHDWLMGQRNVWLGISVVNQEEADRDIPKLLAVPARVRWLSMEPLLTTVDLTPHIAQVCDAGSTPHPAGGGTTCMRCDGSRLSGGCPGIDWLVAGGESGPKARPMHPDWVRSLRDQCAAAGVPFFFKQWGEWAPGECAANTLEMRSVQVADWFVDEWTFHTIDGDSTFHIDDEPTLYRAGKKAAGRLLDGVLHDSFPKVIA
ncbi:protein gp37 [Paucimonas lemoignei]|uniref:Protein gp37 n=1 Tax=Paucimonas lemoignei TaxID=29443 RepID=A0A4R3HXU7_PAULE|nr:phage Gp37/Gp68 family protein [Paucimonas lemoignei]TCS37453.1 protein gp37 [Paucimonas lemoignei]